MLRKEEYVSVRNFKFDSVSVDELHTKRNRKRGANDNLECASTEKQSKCSNKNAVSARMNRLKKKRFVENLQNDVLRLSHENKKLKETLKCQSNAMNSLTKEVTYLKSVLANSNEIGILLKSVVKTGLPITTSLRENISSDILESRDDKNSKRNQNIINSTADHNYVLTTDREESDCENCPPALGADDDVGICLHVCKSKVSLEFCATCNGNALSAWDDLECVK